MRALLTLLSVLVTSLFCVVQGAAQESGGNYEVLHFTKTSGFNHGTSDESLPMFQGIGNDLGFMVVQDSTGSEFNSVANLERFAVVVFSNTSGDNILDATQRANFEAYITGGGSYIGIHAASDTYRHSGANGGSTGTWDWYAETVAGCSVQQNPNHTSQNHNNTMNHIELGHPVLNGIPNPWNKTEEYYYWQNGYLAPGFTEVLRVEQTGNNSYDMPRMTAHVRELPGGGRAFYTALGHAASNFTSDQDFIRLIRNAVEWTAEPNIVTTVEVVPDSINITRGNLGSGNQTSLAQSDNVDLSIRRSSTDIQSKTEFEVNAPSPFASPSSLEMTVEGSVFARSNVVQTVELFDFINNSWVVLDTRNATRFSDSTITASASGDLSRFIDSSTAQLWARVGFRSDSPRQQFTSNTDQVVWTIGR